MKFFKIIFVGFFAFFFVSTNAKVRVMTVSSFNVRNDNQHDAAAGNGWANRCPVIAQMIAFYDWDIVGTQECKVNQVEDLKKALQPYNYDVIGRGRGTNPTDDEFSAIFYKSDRYQLIDHGDFWLSETPYIPSRGWDAALNRICTWGYFKEKKTGFKFYAFNLHFDHIGVKARLESSKLMLRKIDEIAKNKPAFLTGDFNVDQTSESYAELVSTDRIKDSFVNAKIVHATNGTFNDFHIDNVTTERIDHVFVTSQFIPIRYGVFTDLYWTNINGEPLKSSNFPKEVTIQKAKPRLPSDHYPIAVSLSY
ncbi:endonuclease/exonuclease/phosphatase family protein [Paludibacter sp.]